MGNKQNTPPWTNASAAPIIKRKARSSPLLWMATVDAVIAPHCFFFFKKKISQYSRGTRKDLNSYGDHGSCKLPRRPNLFEQQRAW
jgi:hypothetical protein